MQVPTRKFFCYGFGHNMDTLTRQETAGECMFISVNKLMTVTKH